MGDELFDLYNIQSEELPGCAEYEALMEELRRDPNLERELREVGCVPANTPRRYDEVDQRCFNEEEDDDLPF